MTTTKDILSRPCHPQDSCLLFTRLPAELRTSIYECILTVKPDDDYQCIRLMRHLSDEQAPPSVLTLLETCRLIHNEALGIFYEQNRLRLSFRTSLAAGLAPTNPFPYLSPTRLVHIQDLVVRVASFGSIVQVCRLLARDVPGLEGLRIVLRDVYDHYNDGQERDVRMLQEFIEHCESFKVGFEKLRARLREFHLIWEDSLELEYLEARGWREYGEELSRDMGAKIFLYRRGPVRTAAT